MPRRSTSLRKLQEDAPSQLQREELHYDGTHWLLGGAESDLAKKNAPGLVPALENAIAIIHRLNAHGQQDLTLAELSTQLGISKSHCHSLCKTLVHFDWLQFDERTKTYRLAPGILSSVSSLFIVPVLDTARTLLRRMVDKTEAPCVLSQPQSDGSFVLIEKFNGSRSMEVSFPVGHRYPRDAAAHMRAYLAWQAPERLRAWFKEGRPARYTETTLVTLKDIKAELDATRRRGYARSEGEFTRGLMAIALPIFDREGNVAYIFNSSDLIASLLPRESKVATEMIRAAAAIHKTTLGRPPAKWIA
jgi:DNA-binding IclR family transcriptional regulator